MESVVVTGANGFVGYQLVLQLCMNGYHVAALVRSISNSKSLLALKNKYSLEIIECDMEEYRSDKALKLLDPFRCSSAFYHLAWQGSSGIQRSNYQLQLKNVELVCDAVKLAAKLECKKFVGAGSIMEDECQYYIPLKDSTPSLNYHYSIAKYTAYLMAKTEAAHQHIPFFWAKISNAYGAGDVTGRFVITILKKLLADDICRLTPCQQNYDFVYVSEVARAFMLIGERGQPGKTYYIGSNHPAKLEHFVKEMHRITHSNSDLEFGAIPFNGALIPMAIFDSGVLHFDTGFVCQVSFEEGIIRTVEWLKRQREEGKCNEQLPVFKH